MKLTISDREVGKKSSLKKMRHEGQIPTILYRKGSESLTLFIDRAEFEAHLRSIKKGFLATAIFELEVAGKKIKAIVKDIQYHRISYQIEHIDLQELVADEKIRVNVPIQCKGEDRSFGIKQGGHLKMVRRSVKISCLAKDMPNEFVLDVSDLGLNECKRIRDVSLSGSMKVSAGAKDVLVVIGK